MTSITSAATRVKRPMHVRSLANFLILSSTEGLPVASAVQEVLSSLGIESTIWNQHVFPHGELLLNSIVRILPEYGDVVVVLTPDDVIRTKSR